MNYRWRIWYTDHQCGWQLLLRAEPGSRAFQYAATDTFEYQPIHPSGVAEQSSLVVTGDPPGRAWRGWIRP